MNKNVYSTIGLSARRSAQMGVKMKKSIEHFLIIILILLSILMVINCIITDSIVVTVCAVITVIASAVSITAIIFGRKNNKDEKRQ